MQNKYYTQNENVKDLKNFKMLNVCDCIHLVDSKVMKNSFRLRRNDIRTKEPIKIVEPQPPLTVKNPFLGWEQLKKVQPDELLTENIADLKRCWNNIIKTS